MHFNQKMLQLLPRHLIWTKVTEIALQAQSIVDLWQKILAHADAQTEGKQHHWNCTEITVKLAT